MAKSPGLEWWVELAAGVFTGNPGNVAKSLSKLPKLLKSQNDDQSNPQLLHINQVLRQLYLPMPIEPDLNLWGIYVTPWARHRKPGEGSKGKMVPDLLWTLKTTIAASTAPVVLQSQPGHGKTSSMRMLIGALMCDANDPTDTTLFYEFKNLGGLDAPLFTTLQRVTPFVLEQKFFHGRHSLLVLDGLDERQLRHDNGLYLGNFIRDLFMLAQKINNRKDSRLNLVFTGRSLFVDQIKRYFVQPHHRFEILDFHREQVDQWLKKYNRLKQPETPLTRETLESRHLKQLIGQPILLTIVARILADPMGIAMLEELPTENISLRHIYQIIVSWTYRKQHQDNKGISTLPADEATYNRFLQMVAYLMFRNGGESIPLKTLARQLERKQPIFLLDPLNQGHQTQQIIKDLAVGFYFQGLEDNVFAFIHKSIRDYLTVEALYTLLTESLENFSLKKLEPSCHDHASNLYYILGKSAMSQEDHLPFLQDLLEEKDRRGLHKKLVAFFHAAADHSLLILCCRQSW